MVNTDKEFVTHCKQATESLTYINNRLQEDDDLDSLETMSFILALTTVNMLGQTLDDDTTSSEFKWDDDHEFR